MNIHREIRRIHFQIGLRYVNKPDNGVPVTLVMCYVYSGFVLLLLASCSASNACTSYISFLCVVNTGIVAP